jgi:hypothetical protein
MIAAPRNTIDAPKRAKGATESEDAAPSAGGAAPAEVSLACDAPDEVASSVAEFEYGVADEKAPLLAPLVTLWLILLLSLVNPLVSLADIKLVLPLKAALVALLISLLLDVDWKTAWMRISWHWSPIHVSYRLPNAPLMQRHQRVLPPMASESLPQTAKPPV